MSLSNESGTQFLTASELVIGLVAPLGADLKNVSGKLEEQLASKYGYQVEIIRLSGLLKVFDQIGLPVEEPKKPGERYSKLMDAGNQLRYKTRRGDALAVAATFKIQEKRAEKSPGSGAPAFVPKQAYILRSLKHPEEVERLRDIYGTGFYLLGVYSSKERRRKRLTDILGIQPEQVEGLLQRDESDDPLSISQDDPDAKKFTVKTRDVFHLSDAFINMDHPGYEGQITRFLELLFSHPFKTPTKDEHAMFFAHAASFRSGDLSRQVGAVIMSPEGELISTGTNDVPKAKGGLYWESDSSDQRDWKLGKDANQEQRNKLILNIMKALNPEESDDELLLTQGKVKLRDTGILDITEYGRAVHAEMEAILSASRMGISTRGCTLYSTTYPCHNCAKHIVASGITKVVYIEPYPKSYATILHEDSISHSEQPSQGKVAFVPFFGIGPKRFIDLFSMKLGVGKPLKRKNKSDGTTVEWKRQLRVPMSPLSYIDGELSCVRIMKKMEQQLAPEEAGTSEEEGHGSETSAS